MSEELLTGVACRNDVTGRNLHVGRGVRWKVGVGDGDVGMSNWTGRACGTGGLMSERWLLWEGVRWGVWAGRCLVTVG